MKRIDSKVGVIVACVTLLGATCLFAEDWPQWRGPNRDGKVTGFAVPTTWPKELAQKWKATVGAGDSTPALVGDKLFVFSRVGSDEVITCLNVGDGKQAWQDKYPAAPVTGAAAQHPGPRSSPAVADGKVVTLGASGVLSCLDANTGKVVWRKDSAAWPQFFVACSPIIVDGLAVVHLGAAGRGAAEAFDLKSGDSKWKWEGEGPAYSSPVLATIDGTKQIIEATERSVVGLGPADGKLLWQVPLGGGGGGRRGGGASASADAVEPFASAAFGGGGGGGRAGGRRGGGGGGGMGGYNASTPIIDGNTVIFTSAGGGAKAFQVTKQGDAFAAKELWTNSQGVSTQFNTPVLKDGMLYGISNAGNLFCLDAKTGQTKWTDSNTIGQRGFGSVVDAGPVLIALTANSQLTVFKPSDKAYSEVAKVKVGDSPSYAHPVLAGNRVFIKDQDSVALYTIE